MATVLEQSWWEPYVDFVARMLPSHDWSVGVLPLSLAEF
jgi:hypothetical protein